MNAKNLFQKNFVINNSFSRQKIKPSLTSASPFRNINHNKKFNISSIGIMTEKNNCIKNNFKEENNPYLLTEINPKHYDINYCPLTFSPRLKQNKKLLKNIFFNDDYSVTPNNILLSQKNKNSQITFLSKKNRINKYYINEACKSNYNKTNHKKGLLINNINSFMTLSNKNESKEPQFNYKKNNITNYSTNITQSSNSFYTNTHRNKNLYLRCDNNDNNDKNDNKENFKRFKLNIKNNKSYNTPEINRITYIEDHINKILLKENNIKKNKLRIILNKKSKNNDKEIIFPYNHKTLNNNCNTNISNKTINEQNNNNRIKKNFKIIKKINNGNNKNPVKYVDFQDELDNLVHKIKFIENSKEFDNLAKTLTNDELKYILSIKNYNINKPFPVLLKNNQKININFNINLNLKQTHSYEEKNLKPMLTELKTGNNYDKEINLKKPLMSYLVENKNNFKKKEFPKVIYNNKKVNNLNTNIKSNNNIPYKKINKGKRKSVIKDDITAIREDLSFLGNSNRLNWNLISDEDKKKGLHIWEKFMKLILQKKIRKIDNSTIKLDKLNKNLNSDIINIIKPKKSEQNYFELIKYKKKQKELLNKTANVETFQFLKENNERKKKFSLKLSSLLLRRYYSEYQIGKLNGLSNRIKDKNMKNIKVSENDKSIKYNKIDIKNYYNQLYNKTSKYNYNTKQYFNKNNNNFNINKNITNNKTIKDSKRQAIKVKLFSDSTRKKILLKKNKKKNQDSDINKIIEDSSILNPKLNNSNLDDEKDFDIVDLIVNTPSAKILKTNSNIYSSNKISNNILNNNLKKYFKKYSKNKNIYKEKLEKIKIYLMKKYKLSDGNYDEINLDFLKKKYFKKKRRKEDLKRITDDIKIIDLFGLKVRCKNSNNILKEYMIKRNLTEGELAKLIERKNNLLKLIIKLKKERVEKYNKISHKCIIDFGKASDEEEDEDINNNIKNFFKGFPMNNIKFFNKKKLKTRNDIENRKLELLVEIENELKYKIMIGEINLSDYDIYTRLKEKLKNLMNSYNNNVYINILEEIFNDFRKEMYLTQQKKKNEFRINAFIKDLKDQFEIKSIRKKIQEKKIINVVNYNSINHINILNNVN